MYHASPRRRGPGPAGPGVPWMSGCVALYGAAGAGAGDANTRMVRDVARRRWETVASGPSNVAKNWFSRERRPQHSV